MNDGNMPDPTVPGPYFVPPPTPLSVPLQPPVPAARKRASMSWRLLVALGVLTLLALAGAGTAGVVLGAGDWASGEIAAGVTALALGGIYLVITLVRLAPRFAARGSLWIGLSCALVLATIGGTGLVLPAPTHLAQAHYLEGMQDWTAAIHEYQLAGERGAGSEDLARVYDEWGDALEVQGKYVDALAKYETVTASYSKVTAEVRCARVSTARVHYKYGEQLLAQSQYGSAIREFTAVTRAFADTPFASQARDGAASAYFKLAQSELTNDCPSAIIYYQTLVQEYGGTTEASKAQTALTEPGGVIGVLEDLPADVTATMYLSRNVVESTYSFSMDYSAPVNNSGIFTFHGVLLGRYNLMTILSNGNWWYWFYTSPHNPYVVEAGPLCTINAGIFDYGSGFLSSS